jgi:hypothetical protein
MQPLQSFDFRALDQTEFGEDAVREEIIAPIFRALGYAATGRLRIVRSKRLEHPWVSLGTTKKRLSLIPDYVLYVDDLPVFVLDAKAPSEHVLDREHIAQVYSYAINREIRANWFALCNGRHLSVFHVADPGDVPRFHIHLGNLDKNWPAVVAALNPDALAVAPEPFLKDFGIHLMKLGCTADTNIVLIDVPVDHLAKWDDGIYRFTAAMQVDGCEYASTFELRKAGLVELLRDAHRETAQQILDALLSDRPAVLMNFDPPLTSVNILAAELGSQIEENKHEHFVPILVRALDPVEGATHAQYRTLTRGSMALD